MINVPLRVMPVYVQVCAHAHMCACVCAWVYAVCVCACMSEAVALWMTSSLDCSWNCSQSSCISSLGDVWLSMMVCWLELIETLALPGPERAAGTAGCLLWLGWTHYVRRGSRVSHLPGLLWGQRSGHCVCFIFLFVSLCWKAWICPVLSDPIQP